MVAGEGAGGGGRVLLPFIIVCHCRVCVCNYFEYVTQMASKELENNTDSH